MPIQFCFSPEVAEVVRNMPKGQRTKWVSDLILAAAYGGDAVERIELEEVEAREAKLRAERAHILARQRHRESLDARKTQFREIVARRVKAMGPPSPETQRGWDAFARAQGIPRDQLGSLVDAALKAQGGARR